MMNVRERFRRWRHREQRRRALRKEGTSPLREFVYLDEVSVFSLISSRLGPVATEFTATESRSLTGEVSGTGSVSTGLLNLGGTVRGETTRTRGTQVLRKATVQATFKELFDNVEKDLVIRRTPKKAPDGRELRDLELALERGCTEGWAVRAGDLRRGQLAEIEVELEAEDIFRVGAVVGTFLDLFREMPEVVDLGCPWPASGSDVGERPPGQPARWPRSGAWTGRGPRHGKGIEGGVGSSYEGATGVARRLDDECATTGCCGRCRGLRYSGRIFGG